MEWVVISALIILYIIYKRNKVREARKIADYYDYDDKPDDSNPLKSHFRSIPKYKRGSIVMTEEELEECLSNNPDLAEVNKL